MGFDFARRRAELQAAMDLNAIKIGELTAENAQFQKEYRKLELQEHKARANLLRNPTGIFK